MSKSIQALFTATVALPQERARHLEADCTDDKHLEASVAAMIQSGETCDDGTAAAASATLATDTVAGLPNRIAGYRILARLGQGSHGIVFRAEQERPRRQVALKLLHRAIAGVDQMRRFANEVEALARLRHPAIVHIYHAGVAGVWGARLPYLTMELVEGMPLVDWRREHRPDRRACIEIVLQLLEALEYAHQQGVVHRDLKPANIVVDLAEGPRARILDFGVARIRRVDAEPSATQDGTILGTLAYMSPEQAAGESEVDTRSDVYGIGAICYELLCGRVPIESAGVLQEDLRRIRCIEPASLLRHAPDCGRDLDLVVGKALAKRREDRYASAGAFADDLRRVLAHEPVQARQPTWPYLLQLFVRRRRLLVASFAALAVAALVAIGSLAVATVAAQQSRQLAVGFLTKMSRRVFELERSIGTMALREALLADLGHELDDLLAREPHVPEYLSLKADLLAAHGNIEVQRDRRDAALPWRQQALALRRHLVALCPTDLDQRLTLATDIVRLGDLDRVGGDPRGGLPRYLEAHALYTDVVAQKPGDAHALDDLGYSCHRLAHAAIEARAFDRAEDLLAQQGDLIVRLEQVAPGRIGNLALARELSSMRGHLEMARGSFEQASRHLQRSLELSLAWLDRRPDDVEAWIGYLCGVSSLAQRLRQVGQDAAARAVIAAGSASLGHPALQAAEERIRSVVESVRRLAQQDW